MKTPTLVALLAIIAIPSPASSQVHDWEAKTKGDQHFSMRIWMPEGQIRAVVTLAPGLNGDGRGMADDPVWQEFATRNGCALAALSMRGSGYYRASEWSAKTLLDGLSALGKESGRSELSTAPLLMWGLSAGGQFNYNFAMDKPQRVMGFIINKGAYYEERASASGRKVPALCIAGEKDTELRVTNITNLFTDNRRLGARWALLIEPGEGHGAGRSREIAMIFFEDLLAGAKNPWTGNNETGVIEPEKLGSSGGKGTSWFPGEASARKWAEIRGGSTQ